MQNSMAGLGMSLIPRRNYLVGRLAWEQSKIVNPREDVEARTNNSEPPRALQSLTVSNGGGEGDTRARP